MAVFLCVLGVGLVPVTVHAGEVLKGTASWYSTEACRYWESKGITNCPMASGRSLYEEEERKTAFCAMWGVSFGTRVKVSNPKTGASVTAIVLDRGPNKRLSRVIDLSKEAFKQIADLEDGLIEVTVEVLKEV